MKSHQALSGGSSFFRSNRIDGEESALQPWFHNILDELSFDYHQVLLRMNASNQSFRDQFLESLIADETFGERLTYEFAMVV